MIPRTFPSILEAFQTKMVVYALPSVTGLTAWIDYIPVKGVTTESSVLANTYANGGYQVVKTLNATTGLQAWKDYIPVYESASYNKPWSTDIGGYIPAGGLFSIASLFAANEPGVWYDPSDLTTMFQDAAGTTPVTAVEQPVGLILDKSRGLVLGPELVVNGTFDSGTTGWSLGAGWSISGGAAVSDGTSGNSYLLGASPSEKVVVGKTYKVTFSISRTSGGGMLSVQGLQTILSFSASGQYSTIFTATQNNFVAVQQFNFVGSIDNISVKELPGAHASQTTNPDRPVLSARVNLLTSTEDFSANNGFTGLTINTNTSAAPNGTLTADTLTPNNNTGAFVDKTATVPSLSTITISVDVAERVSSNLFTLQFLEGTNSFVSTVGRFDLSTGTKSSGVGSIALKSPGWYRVTMTVALTNAANSVVYLRIQPDTTAGTVPAVVWGADLRVSNVGVGLPAYQRVNTATDYDTVGFPLYLKFNGVNQSLVTPTITPGTDKAQVFAGVRKLSDTLQIIGELGANTDAGVLGGLLLFVNGQNFTAAISQASVNTRSYTPYAAPISAVLAISLDFAQTTAETEIVTKINGVNPTASGATPAGTGNFREAPIYIGRRNNAVFPFNGHLYPLIVRFGPTLTESQITSTEAYVNSKTGAF